MRLRTLAFACAGIALLLSACGSDAGGGGGNNPPPPPANVVPTANAGGAQSVTSGVTVTLNGTGSTDSDGSIASYAWTQTAGAALTLTNGTTSQPTFTAPQVANATVFTFSLVVTDNRAAPSTNAATVNITVNPPVAGPVNVTGQVTFARVPFRTRTAGDPNAGLDYANPVQQPAREVIVRAIDAGTQAVITSGRTNSAGNYTLTVPGNTNIKILVVAHMLSDVSQPLPHWNVSAQDGIAALPYSYTEPAAFNSSAGTHNVAIPSGISAAGVATGTRASGPFAALDTVYQAMQTVISVAPTTNFPVLIIDWGSQTDGTFFQSGNNQRIALLADLNFDTDEFDQHVIAHEFGHYIENNFSRGDSIGGAHAIGDKLDPRVAFGEGFGYAFAAIVLNDPNARDSFVDDAPFTACGVAHCSAGFNIETNPPTNPVGAPNGNYGCWCSESSVWSILWDVYDNTADANDTLALGFQPIWDVLVGPQRTTPAFTSIFSFSAALKAGNGGSSAAINTLVTAQNIDAAIIDAYGTTETHVPTTVPNNAALPVYTVATVGGPAVVMRTVVETSDEGDRHNKLGNRRFVRFNLATARNITITASSSNPNNPDTDFVVFRNGAFVTSATAPPAPNEVAVLNNAAAGEYLIDVYDCANGCSTVEGTPGDYNLTVTIN